MQPAVITLMLVAGDILMIYGQSQSIRYQGNIIAYSSFSLRTFQANINTACAAIKLPGKKTSDSIFNTSDFHEPQLKHMPHIKWFCSTLNLWRLSIRIPRTFSKHHLFIQNYKTIPIYPALFMTQPN